MIRYRMAINTINLGVVHNCHFHKYTDHTLFQTHNPPHPATKTNKVYRPFFKKNI